MSVTNDATPKIITSNPLFIQWLKANEMELMERILAYAKRYDYTRYTSTLIEPWRISIVGLTDSLELLMSEYPAPPALGPDDDYRNDPASAFGLLEAQRHRSRGVNFAMFISLFKYYRQTYHDLIEDNKILFENPKFYYEYVKQFFDRVEIAYSIEWHGRSSEEQIHELSLQNRLLTNQKNLYLTVFDSFSSGAILLDSFGLIINYNQAASEILFGEKHHGGAYYYTEHKTVSTPEWIAEAIYDLSDNTSYRFFYEQIRNKERYIYDAFIRPVDDVSGQFNGFILILSDVTELKSSQEQFELAISATKDGLWDWDLIDNSIYFSPHWKAMVGYTDDELPNELQTWLDLVHPDDLAFANEAIEKSLHNPTIKYENLHRLRHKDGHYIWNLDRGMVQFNDEGIAIRMIGFHTDMSEHVKMMEEIKNTQDLMIAQSRHAAMGEMIGMIAHQWRQPLSIVSMMVNNMLIDLEFDGLNIDQCRINGEGILAQVNYLSTTIDVFRDFFRPDKEKESVAIVDVMNEAISMIDASLRSHDIELTLINNSHYMVRLYPRELLQVFINILKNAKEALMSDGLSARRITIMIEDVEDEVVTTICDNAGGIDPSIMGRIYDPYFSTKDEKTGTGLGLYMSKTIVEKHLSGTIKAENRWDGVCFIITFNASLKNVSQSDQK